MPDLSKVLAQEDVFIIFDNLIVEVHIWKIIRNSDGDIANWRLVYVNPVTLQTWGFGCVSEIIGKTTDEIFGAGASEHYLDVVKKIIEDEQPYKYLDYFPNLDKYFRFTSMPFGDYFITTGDDISQFVKDEQQAQREISSLDRQVREGKEELALSQDALEVQALIQAEKDKIYRVTMFGAQHILNNLLNQMQIINLEIERHPDFDPSVLAALNAITEDARQLMTQLSSVDVIEESKIREAVLGHTDSRLLKS